MPIATNISDKPLAPYVYPEPTNEDLDWAELLTVDLSKFGTPEGNKALAKTLLDAVRSQGFFYVEVDTVPSLLPSADRASRTLTYRKKRSIANSPSVKSSTTSLWRTS